MKRTRKPVINSHVKLIETRRWPVSFASWLIPVWETGTLFGVVELPSVSFTLVLVGVEYAPVFVPPGSPDPPRSARRARPTTTRRASCLSTPQPPGVVRCSTPAAPDTSARIQTDPDVEGIARVLRGHDKP